MANSPVITTPAGNHGESTYGGMRITRGPGGAVIEDVGSPALGPRIPKKGDHDENLADLMDASERRLLATRLLEYLEIDRESRKDWAEQERRGLALMGTIEIPNNDESAGYVNSPGQAQVKLPMLAEATTHFAARAIAELFPATGPVKSNIIGERTKDRVEQADRIETFGNYYFTTLDKGYFADTDQMLNYVPISGSAFRKAAQNWVTGLPQLRYVKATNFVVSYAATTLEDAPRYAHEYTMSGQDVRRAMESGMFADVRLQRPPDSDAKHSPTADRADLRHPTAHDDDALYEIVEYHIQLELDVDDEGAPAHINESWGLLPYVILVEKHNQEILMVRRNWAEEDEQRTKIIWFAHHKFFPGLGFYGWGYPHLIGSLAKAANDGVNALLDSGFANNFQGGFVTKEGKAVGMNGEITMEHGKWKVLDGAFEEISKALWSPDFHPPSPALAQLVEQLVEQFRRFASITEAAVGDADNRGPVGTTLAMIEQSSVIPTAIHKRLHNSMGHEFDMWAKLMYQFMPNEYPYEVDEKKRTLLKQDFDGRVDVVPVSDPNIWSATQRIALSQGTIQLQAQAPDLYPPQQRAEAHRRMLQAMRVPDIDAVGPVVETPKYLDPVAEGQLLLLGKGVKAFEPQNHQGHMMIHNHQRAMLIASPAFASMLPERQQMVLGGFDTHVADHMGLAYRSMIMGQMGIPLPPLDPNGQAPELPPEIESKITALVVQHLPPVPPPQQPGGQGPSPQDEAAALQAKTQAAIQAKGQESDANIERDSKAFIAEEKRKEVAFANEQQRLQRKAQLEASIAAHKTAGEEQRKDVQTGTQIVREGAKAKLQQRTQEALAKQKLTHAHAGKVQELQHNAADAEHQRALADADHQQEQQHGAQEHQQSLSQTDEQHQQQLAQGEEAHESEQERTAEQHDQSIEQTEEAGKVKLQQAKQQAAAKKQAAKKKTASKK